MDPGILSVATRTAGLLVEIGEAEVQMIEKDVPHVGKIDPFAEGGGRDDDAQRTFSEIGLDLTADGARDPGVIERDLVAETAAQRPLDVGFTILRPAGVDDV